MELWTKVKGAEEPYRVMNMEEIKKKVDIPEFDYIISWKKRSERPVRISLPPQRGRVIIPSLQIMEQEKKEEREKERRAELPLKRKKLNT